MIKPAFHVLRSAYTTDPSRIHTCSMAFPNTCAIRMSEALVTTEERWLQAFRTRGNLCPHGYVRGAEDLAAVIGSASGFGPRNYGWKAQPSGDPPAAAVRLKGLICYIGIPGFSGSGHIDLWNMGSAVGSSYWDATTIWLWTLP
jgi:hypothetical protein